MTSPSVRRATIDDVPVLVRIRNDAHAKKVAHGDDAWGKEGDGFSDTWVRNHVMRAAVYVVDLDGTSVGTFSLAFDGDKHWGLQEPIAGYVHGLCVRSGFNGRGLGRFMLDWCAREVRSLNRRWVRLDCAADNAMLCAYYASLGFIRVGMKSDGRVWSLYEKAVD